MFVCLFCLPGQSGSTHEPVCVAVPRPEHVIPKPLGGGFVHVLTRLCGATPSPQVTEQFPVSIQDPHAVQPPRTLNGTLGAASGANAIYRRTQFNDFGDKRGGEINVHGCCIIYVPYNASRFITREPC